MLAPNIYNSIWKKQKKSLYTRYFIFLSPFFNLFYIYKPQFSLIPLLPLPSPIFKLYHSSTPSPSPLDGVRLSVRNSKTWHIKLWQDQASAPESNLNNASNIRNKFQRARSYIRSRFWSHSQGPPKKQAMQLSPRCKGPTSVPLWGSLDVYDSPESMWRKF